MLDWGLFIIRLVIGLLFIGHGMQKLFGWFGGYGLKGTGGWFESIGIKPGVPMVFLVGLFELVGGALFAAGVWLWIAAVLIAIIMLGTMITVHAKNGLWVDKGGIEYPLVLITVVIGIALVGPGAFVLF